MKKDNSIIGNIILLVIPVLLIILFAVAVFKEKPKQENIEAKESQIASTTSVGSSTESHYLGTVYIGSEEAPRPLVKPKTIEKITLTGEMTSDQVIGATNNARIDAGLETLSLNQKLISAAELKLLDIQMKAYWSHTNPKGVTFKKFIDRVGYVYTYAGENLASGFTDSKDQQTAFMNSPTHKANILQSKYKEIGVAIGNAITDSTQKDSSGRPMYLKGDIISVIIFATPAK